MLVLNTYLTRYSERSVGAIVGIVIGVIVAIATIVTIAVCLCCACARSRPSTQGQVITAAQPNISYVATSNQSGMQGVSQPYGFHDNSGFVQPPAYNHKAMPAGHHAKRKGIYQIKHDWIRLNVPSSFRSCTCLKLSVGAIIGIVIGVIVAIGTIVTIAVCLCCACARSTPSTQGHVITSAQPTVSYVATSNQTGMQGCSQPYGVHDNSGFVPPPAYNHTAMPAAHHPS
ncbi:unnamed protein product [Mytilus edulis]|uniref:Uncharacterized protein n=1 Tax=Mytilus edulis TaxID=6550 RepID=A0A8S3TQI0_MYTED|nr:unnamed protein product [Mytilus edulis]